MKVTDEVLSQIRQFMSSRAILTATELDLFTRLEAQANAQELAIELGTDSRALSRLLDSLVALGYLEKESGVYSLSDKGAVLSSKHEESVLPMVEHLNELWDTWSELTEAVKKGGRPGQKAPTEREEQSQKAFIGAMHVVGRQLAWEIASVYDLTGFSRLLDVGGASGTYTAAFLHKNPKLQAVIFDLPDVIPMAKERMKKEGLSERVGFHEGDFYKDELPTGFDIVFLSAIIHQNSQEENLQLYEKVFRALQPGGYILIRDHIMNENRIWPSAGALFSLNMLVNTPGGDTYTFEEVKETLKQAGLKEVRLVRSGEEMDCLVEGKK